MATTLDAPPEQVWPWLIQMGQDRAGWYSWDGLDNFGRRSAWSLYPEWQQVGVGDRVVAKPENRVSGAGPVRGRVGAVRIESADDAMFGERDAWHYEPPYDFYDSDGLPVRNPEFFFAARDEDGTLIGFYFLEPREGALFYGFGMRPDLTGRGLGEQFVVAGLEFARLRYSVRRVVLDVAAFNERAIRLYRRIGFDETGRHVKTFDGYGAVEFIDMERLDGAEPG